MKSTCFYAASQGCGTAFINSNDARNEVLIPPASCKTYLQKGFDHMKRNYLAILLGLTLALSPVSAFASEDSTEALTEAAAENEAAVNSEAEDTVIVGQVSDITDDSITIIKGTLLSDESGESDLAPENSSPDGENTEQEADDANSDENTSSDVDTDSEEDTNSGADVDSEAETDSDADVNAEDESADTETGKLVLVLSDESSTYAISENTVVRELADMNAIRVTADDTESSDAENSDTETNDAERIEVASENTNAEAEDTNTEVADVDAEAEDTDTDGADAAVNASEDEAALIVETSALSEDDTFDITADGIMEGDIVSIHLNEDGTVDSITLLSYGTGADTNLASDNEIMLYSDAESEVTTE